MLMRIGVDADDDNTDNDYGDDTAYDDDNGVLILDTGSLGVSIGLTQHYSTKMPHQARAKRILNWHLIIVIIIRSLHSST